MVGMSSESPACRHQDRPSSTDNTHHHICSLSPSSPSLPPSNSPAPHRQNPDGSYAPSHINSRSLTAVGTTQDRVGVAASETLIDRQQSAASSSSGRHLSQLAIASNEHKLLPSDPSSPPTLTERIIPILSTSVLPTKPTMIFSDFQKSQALAHRKRIMATTSALTEYEADLTSKDRMKQKDAIRRILVDKVKNDWAYEWPDNGCGPQTQDEDASASSQLLDIEWIERDDWESNVSESEDDAVSYTGSQSSKEIRQDAPHPNRNSKEERRRRRQRRLAEEMRINDGLNCFVHRRDAWTCARKVPLHHASASTSTSNSDASQASSASIAIDASDTDPQPEEYITQIPLAPPILPPDIPVRACITPKAYSTIYDKVVLQSQTPFCPINLSVIVSSCVEGWKRNNEWPPKTDAEIEAGIARRVGAAGAAAGGPADMNVEGEGRSALRRSLKKVIQGVVQTGKRRNT